MSLELLERLLCQLVPEEAKNPVHNIITRAKEDPIRQMGEGFNHLLHTIQQENTTESRAAVSGMLLGIVLHYGCQRSPAMESMIEEYIEHKKKERGSNIVDFATRRAEVKR